MRARLLKKWSLDKRGEDEMGREVTGPMLEAQQEALRELKLASQGTTCGCHQMGPRSVPLWEGKARSPASRRSVPQHRQGYTPVEFERELQEAVLRTHCSGESGWPGFKAALQNHQFSSVTQSCLTLCDPMDSTAPGLSVHHQLLELAQTHVLRVGDAIQPSHPQSSPSSCLQSSQHQGLFQWVSSSHEVTKVLGACC